MTTPDIRLLLQFGWMGAGLLAPASSALANRHWTLALPENETFQMRVSPIDDEMMLKAVEPVESFTPAAAVLWDSRADYYWYTAHLYPAGPTTVFKATSLALTVVGGGRVKPVEVIALDVDTPGQALWLLTAAGTVSNPPVPRDLPRDDLGSFWICYVAFPRRAFDPNGATGIVYEEKP